MKTKQRLLSKVLILFFAIMWIGRSKAITIKTSNVTTGNWSTASSWTTSGSGSPVVHVIQSGHAITLNTGISGIDTIKIDGTLNMGNNQVLTMNLSGAILIGSAGTLQGGSNNTEIRFGAGTSTFISGPFTSTNIITNGPRYGNYSTMVAAGGNPQGSFPVLLPVDLKSIGVEKRNKEFILVWTALGKANQNSFDIEISTNGSTFSLLGTIKGNGELSEGNYKFLLGSIKSSFYVRLSEIKGQLKKKLATKFVKNQVETAQAYRLFPTVINGNTGEINVVIPEAGEYLFIVYSLSMEVVANTKISTSSEFETTILSTADLNIPKGTFIVIVADNTGKHYSTKIVVQ